MPLNLQKHRNEEKFLRIVIGITGASGSIYAYRLIDFLAKENHEIHLVFTKSGASVLEYECKISVKDLEKKVFKLYDNNDFFATVASGSFRTEAMVIVPCSMKTVGLIANGISMNLLTRVADVTIKEGRPLLIVPRETPLNTMHLENLLKLSKAGVRILPASPGFYHLPQNLNALVDMLVGKICDNLGIDNNLFTRWKT